jgi:hypothetical protein
MKKVVLILSVVFVAASCQKETIVPNGTSSQDITKSATFKGGEDDNTHGGGTGTIYGDDTNPTDPTDPDDGSITDPMKKKDKKDSK